MESAGIKSRDGSIFFAMARPRVLCYNCYMLLVGLKIVKLFYKENIYIIGIENVAKGFVDMLSGKNIVN